MIDTRYIDPNELRAVSEQLPSHPLHSHQCDYAESAVDEWSTNSDANNKFEDGTTWSKTFASALRYIFHCRQATHITMPCRDAGGMPVL